MRIYCSQLENFELVKILFGIKRGNDKGSIFMEPFVVGWKFGMKTSPHFRFLQLSSAANFPFLNIFYNI